MRQRKVTGKPHLVDRRLHEVGVESPRDGEAHGHPRLEVGLSDLLHDVARLRRPGHSVVTVAQEVGDL